MFISTHFSCPIKLVKLLTTTYKNGHEVPKYQEVFTSIENILLIKTDIEILGHIFVGIEFRVWILSFSIVLYSSTQQNYVCTSLHSLQ